MIGRIRRFWAGMVGKPKGAGYKPKGADGKPKGAGYKPKGAEISEKPSNDAALLGFENP
jgi:hypothetical protein